MLIKEDNLFRDNIKITRTIKNIEKRKWGSTSILVYLTFLIITILHIDLNNFQDDPYLL